MKKRAPIAIVVGTRPEIIKMAPVIRACQKAGVDFLIVHTNQHYSLDMDAVFFKELELPAPDINLGIRADGHGAMTGRMLEGLEKVFLERRPSAVLAEGDTNSVLAAALAASKLEIPFGHVEAGLRSFDRTMPEELNRIVADHLATYLFAPTEMSKRHLADEGITKNVFVTGNTIVDAVKDHVLLSQRRSTILRTMSLTPDTYAILTLHRPANVDNAKQLRSMLEGISSLTSADISRVVFPMHPRTKKNIEAFGLTLPDNVVATGPMGYLDMLALITNARLVLTDSGGLQEEACVLKVPCVTLRENTERPETLEVGANVLAGSDSVRIVETAKQMLSRQREWGNPFGEQGSGARIVELLPARL